MTQKKEKIRLMDDKKFNVLQTRVDGIEAIQNMDHEKLISIDETTNKINLALVGDLKEKGFVTEHREMRDDVTRICDKLDKQNEKKTSYIDHAVKTLIGIGILYLVTDKILKPDPEPKVTIVKVDKDGKLIK